jgi:Skp family chaperone for outer membrane proteins
MSRALFAGVAAALSLAPAIGWSATTAPETPALGGPQIPALCSLSQQAVLANAKVGAAAAARLKQLTEQSQAEVNAERNALEAEAKSLQAQQATLKPADLKQRRDALARRVQALQQKAELRSREIEITREKVLARIAGEAQPVIAEVYGQRGCGLLIDRNTIMGGNMGGDLTAAVVQGLDAKITTITFERESLAAASASAPATH